MSKSFNVNLSFSCPVIFEKIFKWPHPIFVIIFTLIRTWPFIWSNLNFLYSKIICTKRLIKFGKMVLEKILKDYFPNTNICKTGFNIRPLGTWFTKKKWKETWIYIIFRSFRVNLSFSGPVVLEKMFWWPHSILVFLWFSPLWRRLGPLFEQTWSIFTQG
jgi:hypothetical protein